MDELKLDAETAHSLAAAVERVMSPYTSAAERHEAHNICEHFKDNSKIAVQYGFRLAQKENSAVVRHFGLQLIEHCIKYRWNDITDADKNGLKLNTLQVMDQGTLDMLVEAQHIKDAVSRTLVELMKRVWPQLWDGLFTDFSTLCQHGPSQTELVLQTLLRFAEDVVRFQNIPQQRRQELRLALTQAMSSIFTFLMFVMKTHLETYRTQSGETKERSRRVCLSILETFTGYLDWVSVVYIQESQIVQHLCALLVDKELCLSASECLLLIVGRKGRIQDRSPLLVIFEIETMTSILQAANNATEHITEANNFVFLKRLCEVLLETGKQLATLWGSNQNVGQPPNFEMYLQALIAFTEHPSQSLRHMIYMVWVIFLRHVDISKDQLFQAVVPRLIKCCTIGLYKVGYPSQSNSPSCDYSRLEFDTDEEFNVLLSNVRVIVVETVRLLAQGFPKLTFAAVSAWLMENLAAPINIGPASARKNVEQGICNQSSPSFLSWDACSTFTEACMSKIFVSDQEQPSKEEGSVLLYKLLDYDIQDPLILSAILSCISALFRFLNHTPDAAPRVVTKIFGAVQFSLPGQTKSKRSQAVKNVRTHACSVLVKVCKNYTDLFMQEFDHLYSCMKQLDLEQDQLSQMEKIIILEALIIISNNFNNFSRQSLLMEEIFAPIKQLWSSPDITRAFSSPECFMSYVGLNQPAVEPSSADTCGINRSHILYCINTMYAVLKRSKCPDDYNVAQAGGFVVAGPDGKSMRNPATTHVKAMMDNLVTLLKTVSCLYKPEYMALRHNDFIKAYDVMDHDKHTYLGIPPVCVDNSDALVYRHPLERMKTFITTVLETGYLVLGNACSCFGTDFYSIPNIARGINENLLNFFDLLPDFRVKFVIRSFLKLFVQSCPKEQLQTAVVPVLVELCPRMLQRLNVRWKEISDKAEEMSRNDEEEDPESQEVLEAQMTRACTKEYFDVLLLILLGKASSVEVKEEQEMEEDSESVTQTKTSTVALSNLGQAIVDTKELWPCLMMTVLTAFSWPDTSVFHRCVVIIPPLCKELISRSALSSQEIQHVFLTILSSLQIHGQHDACSSALIAMATVFYENYRKQFPCLAEVLLQIPNVDRKLVQDLEEKFVSPPKAHPEKKKRDQFKKIVGPLIAKDISQKFQRSAQFSTLPTLFLESRRAKYPRVDETPDTEDLGLCELFTPTAQS